MEEHNLTKGIQVNVNYRDVDTVTIVKSNTSLHITIPSKWKREYDLKAGDELDLALLSIHHKSKEGKKKKDEQKNKS